MHAAGPIVSALLALSPAAQFDVGTEPPAPQLIVAPEAVTDDVVVTGERLSHAPAVIAPVRSHDVDLTTLTKGLIREVKRDTPPIAETDRRIAADGARDPDPSQ